MPAAFRYILEPNSLDSHQSSPYWLALVVRFKRRDTYRRESLLRRELNPTPDDGDGSFSTAGLRGKVNTFIADSREQELRNAEEKYNEIPANNWDLSRPDVKANPVEEAKPILLEHEIQTWSVSQGKSSPQSVATFQLHHAGVDYRRVIAAGDWVMFWAFDNQADYLRVRQNLRQPVKARSNAFMDGLKFVGRIQGPRRRRSRQGASGVLNTSYTMSAVGFKEFSYTIYYHPAMMGKYGPNTLQYMADFTGDVNDFLLGNGSGTGSIQAGKAINALLRVCMGMGPSAEWKAGVNPEALAPDAPPPPALNPSPNGRVLIPATVAEVLLGDSTGRQMQPRTYVDILKSWIGQQKYAYSGRGKRQNVTGGGVPSEHLGRGLSPSSLGDLSGDFLPQPVDFNQKSVWSILQTYLNDPINEMYATLKTDPNGYVMPFLVARQMPFSSDAFSKSVGVGEMTLFTSLPRWVISPKLVMNEDLGASDALKYNFVFLPSRDIANQGKSEFMNVNQNYVQNPPLVDGADIERSGLQMYSKMIGARVNPTMFKGSGPGQFWSRLMADVLMGQHLRFTGTLDLTFIQEPISIGDNAQYDGGLYHIERISHQGSISPDGRRTASTQLQLTHGLSIETDKAGDNVYMIDDDDRPQHTEATDRAKRSVDPEDHRLFIAHSEDRRH